MTQGIADWLDFELKPKGGRRGGRGRTQPRDRAWSPRRWSADPYVRPHRSDAGDPSARAEFFAVL